MVLPIFDFWDNCIEPSESQVRVLPELYGLTLRVVQDSQLVNTSLLCSHPHDHRHGSDKYNDRDSRVQDAFHQRDSYYHGVPSRFIRTHLRDELNRVCSLCTGLVQGPCRLGASSPAQHNSLKWQQYHSEAGHNLWQVRIRLHTPSIGYDSGDHRAARKFLV